MSILGDITSGASDALKELTKDSGALTDEQTDQFRKDGFLVPSTYTADGVSLPYGKVPSKRDAQIKRNVISWLVPQFGIVKMFINPQNITYSNKKIIHRDLTKGGYTLQYWGEELGTISLTGTTGSSGIEGMNALYEIYRAEQYAFDSVGLTIASNNAAADLASNAVNAAGGALGSALFGGSNDPTKSSGASLGAGILGGILGMDSPSASLATQNFNSLAQMAFTVEMYYDGWVYRGYFDSMNITEKANDFLLDYSITFITTQRRGYRTNYFPWHRDPKSGASRWDTPYSFSGKITG